MKKKKKEKSDMLRKKTCTFAPIEKMFNTRETNNKYTNQSL